MIDHEAREKDTEKFLTHVVAVENTDKGWRITTPSGCLDVPRSSPDTPAPWIHAPVLCYGREFGMLRGIVISDYVYCYETAEALSQRLKTEAQR